MPAESCEHARFGDCPYCRIATLERGLEEAGACRETGNYSPIPCPNCGRIRVMLPIYECEECGWTPDIGFDPIDEVRERAEQAEAERNDLQQWVHDLQSGMYINCVYCGHRYGPDDEISGTMQDALKAHVERCHKHPMSELRTKLDAAYRAIEKHRELFDTYASYACRVQLMGYPAEQVREQFLAMTKEIELQRAAIDAAAKLVASNPPSDKVCDCRFARSNAISTLCAGCGCGYEAARGTQDGYCCDVCRNAHANPPSRAPGRGIAANGAAGTGTAGEGEE